ncbi:ribonuclease H-like domain-containing protein [Tanacetum coccineum]|uniref:Ribonuclease H-like domain-containing protein n=1 Tax=Tanacetum coccineum TaxID=301880 RepID=A0ABQ4WJH4_9ASTR
MSMHGCTDDEYENSVHSENDNVTLISKLDVSHPLHLHPNDSVALTVAYVKLKRTENYQVWSCAVLLALEGKNKIGSIDDLVNVIDISKLGTKVSHSNETKACITKVGNMILNENLTMYDVLVDPEYCVSLMSIHKVVRDNKLIVAFDESKCYVLPQDLRNMKMPRIDLAIPQISFKQSNSGYSLFTKSGNSSFVALLVYVDDIIITGNNAVEIENFKKFSKTKFLIKDLGQLKYFLGIEVFETEQVIKVEHLSLAAC